MVLETAAVVEVAVKFILPKDGDVTGYHPRARRIGDAATSSAVGARRTRIRRLTYSRDTNMRSRLTLPATHGNIPAPA